MRLIRLFTLIVLCACSPLTEQEKLELLLDSDHLKIQRNFYGGLAGYGEDVLYFELSDNRMEFLIEPDSRKATQSLVRSFIRHAYKTNDTAKIMSGSCLGTDFEYVLSTGSVSLTLRPDEKCDSIFGVIVEER